MALAIHNMRYAIIHALVTLKKKHIQLDGSINRNRTYQLKRDFLLKRLENMGLKS
jgi:hypothetical protein